MAPKDSKDGHHHNRLSSLFHGKKKEPRVKKGLGEALGAIGLRPDEDGECTSGRLGTEYGDTFALCLVP